MTHCFGRVLGRLLQTRDCLSLFSCLNFLGVAEKKSTSPNTRTVTFVASNFPRDLLDIIVRSSKESISINAANMSWRNQGITGSNNIPLGKMRRFGADGDSDAPSAAPSVQYPTGNGDMKRGRSVESKYTRDLPATSLPMAYGTCDDDANIEPGSEPDGPRRRKKRNRWGDATENKAAGLMGLPTAIVANMTSEQLEAYTLHLRIEEITQKLKIDDVVPAEGDRYVCFSPHSSLSMLCANGNLLQVSISRSAIRQPRTACQHSRVPLPEAPRRRTPQVDRESHEDHPQLSPPAGLPPANQDPGEGLRAG